MYILYSIILFIYLFILLLLFFFFFQMYFLIVHPGQFLSSSACTTSFVRLRNGSPRSQPCLSIPLLYFDFIQYIQYTFIVYSTPKTNRVIILVFYIELTEY